MPGIRRHLAGVAAVLLLCLVPGCAFPAPAATHPTLAISLAVQVTALPAPGPRVAAQPPAPPPPAPPPGPDPVALEYFAEIAFGSEFGDTDETIHKWTRNPTIAVHGSPNTSDIDELHLVVSELNALTETIDIGFVEHGAASINVHFLPEHQFATLIADYVPGNIGYFAFRWDASRNITLGQVLISTTISGQRLRNHVIREEITQVLGLGKDSFAHRDSIFYQDHSMVTRYTDLDRTIIQFLYRPAITPGMTREQALAVLGPTGGRP